MRGVTAALLRAARILNADADLQPVWARVPRTTWRHCPPATTRMRSSPTTITARASSSAACKPAIKPGGLLPDGNSLPMWLFDLCNAGERATTVANATFDAAFRNGIGPRYQPCRCSPRWRSPQRSSDAPDAVRYLIPAQIQVKTPERGTAYKNGGVLANRMTLARRAAGARRAAPGARVGSAAPGALAEQSAAPGEDPIVASSRHGRRSGTRRFNLLARGAFLVTHR